MAGKKLSLNEVLQELQMDKAELDQLIAQGRIKPTKEGGKAVFSADQVALLKAEAETKATLMAGGLDGAEFIVESPDSGDYITEAEAIAEMGGDRKAFQEGLRSGKLKGMQDAGVLKFQRGQIRAYKAELSGPEDEAGGEEHGDFLSVEEALQELQLSRRELDQLTTEGKLTPISDGGVLKFNFGEVAALRERRERGSTLVEDVGSDIGVMTADEVMQELGIERAELDTLVKERRLSPLDGVPGLAFTANDVHQLKEDLEGQTAFENMGEQGPTITYDEALLELQVSREELDHMVLKGQLKPIRQDGEVRFSFDEIQNMKKDVESKPTMMEEGDSGGQQAGGGLFLVDEEAGDVSLDSVLMEARRPGESGMTDALSGEDGLEIADVPADKGAAIKAPKPAAKPPAKGQAKAPAKAAGADEQTAIIPEEGDAEAEAEESIFDFAEDDLDLDSSDSSVVDIRVGSGAGEQKKEGSGVLHIGDSLKLDVDESSDLIQIDEEIASSEILDLEAEEESSDESSAESDIVTDVLKLGEEESSEENILADIIPEGAGVIEEVTEVGDIEMTAPAEDTMTVPEDTMTVGETIDATADVTQLDQEGGGYEGTDLGTALGEDEAAEEYEEGGEYVEEVEEGGAAAAAPAEVVYAETPEEPASFLSAAGLVIGFVLLLGTTLFNLGMIEGQPNALTQKILDLLG